MGATERERERKEKKDPQEDRLIMTMNNNKNNGHTFVSWLSGSFMTYVVSHVKTICIIRV